MIGVFKIKAMTRFRYWDINLLRFKAIRLKLKTLEKSLYPEVMVRPITLIYALNRAFRNKLPWIYKTIERPFLFGIKSTAVP